MLCVYNLIVTVINELGSKYIKHSIYIKKTICDQMGICCVKNAVIKGSVRD